MAITYGRVPRPDITMKIIPRSPRGSGGSGNQAWDNLGPRKIVGTCVHRMEGNLSGTDTYFRGEARLKALTDYGIGGALDGPLDGHIWQWIEDGAQVAPWANGGSDGLEGDGPAFVRAYGVNAINRDLLSVELSGMQNTPVTPKQLEATAQLIAYIHDQARVPWDVFPVHPASGVVTQMQHWEFSTKACPFGVVRGLTDEYQDRVRVIMKQYQTELKIPTPVPPAPTPSPLVEWGSENDVAFAKRQFGTVVRKAADGTALSSPTGFDPKGVISTAWLKRAYDEGMFPEAESWTVYTFDGAEQATAEEVRFANGWVLVKVAGDAINDSWHWVGVEGWG